VSYTANDVTEFCFDGLGMSTQSIEKTEIKHIIPDYVSKNMLI
jgi:hypothetical protein